MFYIKVNNIIVPDNYVIFFKHDQITLRQIKRAKNNLLLAVEKKYKIKDDMGRELQDTVIGGIQDKGWSMR